MGINTVWENIYGLLTFDLNHLVLFSRPVAVLCFRFSMSLVFKIQRSYFYSGTARHTVTTRGLCSHFHRIRVLSRRKNRPNRASWRCSGDEGERAAVSRLATQPPTRHYSWYYPRCTPIDVSHRKFHKCICLTVLRFRSSAAHDNNTPRRRQRTSQDVVVSGRTDEFQVFNDGFLKLNHNVCITVRLNISRVRVHTHSKSYYVEFYRQQVFHAVRAYKTRLSRSDVNSYVPWWKTHERYRTADETFTYLVPVCFLLECVAPVLNLSRTEKTTRRRRYTNIETFWRISFLWPLCYGYAWKSVFEGSTLDGNDGSPAMILLSDVSRQSKLYQIIFECSTNVLCNLSINTIYSKMPVKL